MAEKVGGMGPVASYWFQRKQGRTPKEASYSCLVVFEHSATKMGERLLRWQNRHCKPSDQDCWYLTGYVSTRGSPGIGCGYHWHRLGPGAVVVCQRAGYHTWLHAGPFISRNSAALFRWTSASGIPQIDKRLDYDTRAWEQRQGNVTFPDDPALVARWRSRSATWWV